jgi:hypothetical protein
VGGRLRSYRSGWKPACECLTAPEAAYTGRGDVPPMWPVSWARRQDAGKSLVGRTKTRLGFHCADRPRDVEHYLHLGEVDVLAVYQTQGHGGQAGRFQGRLSRMIVALCLDRWCYVACRRSKDDLLSVIMGGSRLTSPGQEGHRCQFRMRRLRFRRCWKCSTCGTNLGNGPV